MKFIVILGLIFAVLQVIVGVGAAPCEKESLPWVETVDMKDGCEAGKQLRFQCRDCTCDDGGKTASCPKWVKCCKLGEVWSTNSCNMCYCDEKFQRICKAVPCLHRKY